MKVLSNSTLLPHSTKKQLCLHNCPYSNTSKICSAIPNLTFVGHQMSQLRLLLHEMLTWLLLLYTLEHSDIKRHFVGFSKVDLNLNLETLSISALKIHTSATSNSLYTRKVCFYRPCQKCIWKLCSHLSHLICNVWIQN